MFTGTVRRTSPDYWRQPLRWNRYAAQRNVRERVFCASMSDVLDAAWSESLLVALFGLIQATPSLDWLLLSKRPENFVGRLHAAWTRASETGRSEVADMLCRWSQHEPPPNVWMGVTVENEAVAASRLRALYAIPAAIRFVSAEPLLGPIDLLSLCTDPPNSGFAVSDGFGRFDGEGDPLFHWLICGGESGPNARPMNADHARLLRDQCHEAGVKFFFKQWGEHDERGTRVGKKQSGRLLDGREWNEIPA